MREIPVVRNDRLTLGKGDGDTIVVGAPAWFAWLQTVAIFVVDKPAGRFTVRREHAPHGTQWYAYRRNRGMLRRIYVGKTEDITSTRLEQGAESLAQTTRVQSRQLRVRHRHHTVAQSTANLLATKLLIPPLRPLLIERSMALGRLHQALEYPLTVLSAPTGYGKATLLAQWIAAAQLRVAWVSLDAGDTDPTRFWTYVVAALEPQVPGLTQLMLPAIQSPTPQLADDDLAALINLLAAVPAPVVLVLDDYHAIGVAATTIHTNLIFIVDHLPANAHIILASRSDPPLPLARLRAHSQLNELHTADLQFTVDEAARFLTRTLGVIVPANEITQLYDHIEGWITGWQLAALSFQGRDNIASLAGSFDGRNPYIVEFLAAEVLQNLPSEQLQFLLQTASLDQLNASLCDAVTGRHDSQTTLATFERDHLFLEPLDDDHQWYRYHYIFAEALRLIGRQTQAAQIPTIQRRASQWYAAHGNNAAAIEAAFLADDLDEAARLIATIAAKTLTADGTAQLEQWLARLPEAALRRYPMLAVTHAYGLLFNGQFSQFAQEVLAIERSWQPANARHLQADGDAIQGEITALCATVAALHGNQIQCLALARQAHTSLLALHALSYPALVNLGIAYWLNGDMVLAAQTLDEVRRQSERQDNAFYYFTSAAYLARVLIHQGRLREAYDLCYAVTNHARATDFPRENAAVTAYLGIVFAQRNEFEAAAYHLEQCLEQPQSLVSMTDCACALAGVRHAQGDVASAAQTIDHVQAARLAAEPFLAAFAAAFKARLGAVHGDWEEANDWAATHDHDEDASQVDAPQYLRAFERLVSAQIALVQGRYDEVLRLTTASRAATAEERSMGGALAPLVLAAIAHAAHNDITNAYDSLRRALIIAAPEGIVQAFTWGGELLRELLMEMRAAPERLGEIPTVGRLLTFIDLLLATLGVGKQARPARVVMSTNALAQRKGGQPVVASLSTREREVVRLLAVGASNQDLARTLVIEMGTVKRHLSNIYAKLGVESRAQAIARAHTLGLLDA